MKLSILKLTTLALFTAALGCSHAKKVEPITEPAHLDIQDQDVRPTELPEAHARRNVISVDVQNLKDRKKKFDFKLVIKNESQGYRRVIYSDIQCFRGTHQGAISPQLLKKEDQNIDLPPGKKKSLELSCILHGPATGGYQVNIARIYDVPAENKKILGRVIGENLQWNGEEK